MPLLWKRNGSFCLREEKRADALCLWALQSSVDDDGRRCFELDREEFQSLRKRLSRVVDVLRESVELRRETLSLTEHLRELQNSVPSENREAPASEDVALRSDKITQEDVDNLQIDLETCKDVSEFIDRM